MPLSSSGCHRMGKQATFDPMVLAEADQRILGSNYGSCVPRRDIPMLVDAFMEWRTHAERNGVSASTVKRGLCGVARLWLMGTRFVNF